MNDNEETLSSADDEYMQAAASAQSMYRLYDAYLKVGFTENQAMTLLVNLMNVSIQAGVSAHIQKEAAKLRRREEAGNPFESLSKFFETLDSKVASLDIDSGDDTQEMPKPGTEDEGENDV